MGSCPQGSFSSVDLQSLPFLGAGDCRFFKQRCVVRHIQVGAHTFGGCWGRPFGRGGTAFHKSLGSNEFRGLSEENKLAHRLPSLHTEYLPRPDHVEEP